METNTRTPETLLDAARFFADPDVCLEYMIPLVWPKGITCRHCGAKEPMFLKTRRIWKCKACRKQFSIKTGTVMEDSPLGLDKWLIGIWLIASAKNGISSWELHRALGITQKTAWFLLHRIRLAMQRESFDGKLMGEVEVDETFIGGAARFKHKKDRSGIRGMDGKAVVMGLLERGGEVRTRVVENTKAKTLQPVVHEHVEKGSAIYTDAHQSYVSLGSDFAHQFIDHAVEYVNGRVHTNGMENFWSLLKRAIKGTYVAVEPFHLFRYVDEQAYRFNSRKMDDGERFAQTCGAVKGKRLTYKALIGGAAKEVPPSSGGIGDSGAALN